MAIKMNDIELVAALVSAELKSGLRVEAQGRNGATALDLYDESGCIKMLMIGTKNEAYQYLRAMAETLYIVGRDVDAS